VASPPLFSDGPAADISYTNIRDAADKRMQAVRKSCEEFWKVFKPFADREFRTEIKSSFDARYWEMYLANALVTQGFKIDAPKPGPDLGIHHNGVRIWFEATSPERGANDNPDQVPDIKFATAGENLQFQDVPNESMLLRYLNSISEKRRQYTSWLQQGIVAPEDAFIIAINPRRLRHDFRDGDPPRILQAAYPIGSPYAALDPPSGKTLEAGYQFQDKIVRKKVVEGKEVEVATGVFLLPEYACVSGLLCSRVDAANQPPQVGADFQLVENYNAKAPMPDLFRLKGTFLRIEKHADSYRAMRETHS
jgi:hypothetical protein